MLCVKLDLEMDLARQQVGPRYSYQLGRVRYGDFETDASYLFAKIKGNEVSYSAATMTKILYRNQTLDGGQGQYVWIASWMAHPAEPDFLNGVFGKIRLISNKAAPCLKDH